MPIVEKCSKMTTLSFAKFNGLKKLRLHGMFQKHNIRIQRFSVRFMHQTGRVQRIRSHSMFSRNWPEILGTQTVKHDGREMTTMRLRPQTTRMKVGRGLHRATGFNKVVM